ncbi:MTOR-associated protein MEAK7 isoform X2 [Maylandia zebra]|uniref:MTOR-associated protein MEAK7 isoform X2 n=1 Tax=Maylandia zebra TaxID=106582 RepID=UPI00403C8026
MGNAESVVVQKRLARFRPEERPVVEGVFDKLQGGAGGAAGKTITLEMLQPSVGSVAPGSMVRRVYRCMSSIDPGLAAPAATGKAGYAGPSGVSREQLIVFLADTLRGTAEERAPLVMAMSQHAAGAAAVVTCEQVLEFLQDLVSAVVQILVHRGRLQGWKPERMGDISLGVKLLAEQMCSELKPSDEGDCDVSCLEDWIFRVQQVSQYLELLVAEGLSVSLSNRPAPTLLPPCRETPWNELKCLLDIPTLMFLAPQQEWGRRRFALVQVCRSRHMSVGGSASFSSFTIRIPPEQEHRGCSLHRTALCPLTPGQQQHLRQNAVYRLQFSIQYNPPLTTHQETDRPGHQFPHLQMVTGLPDQPPPTRPAG